MLDVFEKQILLFDKPIIAQVTKTEDGIQVLVAGGDKSHIGAIAIVNPDGEMTVTTFPGHKETVIVEKWANAFYQKYHQPVVVSAGIHYDGISKDQIKKILAETDCLLKDLLK